MVAANWSWVWDVIYSPFGGVAAIFDTTTKLDMRFPGQWFQLESGLAYNWHRHYDASLGRYVQPVPLRVDEREGETVGGVTPSVLQAKPTLVEQIYIRSGAPRFGAADGTTAAYSPKRANYPDGPSIYGYSTQNPLAKVDPKGLIIFTQSYSPKSDIGACVVNRMDCWSARKACKDSGIKVRTCDKAYTNCISGFTTIFGPGIVGEPTQ